MENKCPRCGSECSFEEEFKCKECGELFWQSKELYEKNKKKPSMRSKEEKEREATLEYSEEKKDEEQALAHSKERSGISGYLIVAFVFFKMTQEYSTYLDGNTDTEWIVSMIVLMITFFLLRKGVVNFAKSKMGQIVGIILSGIISIVFASFVYSTMIAIAIRNDPSLNITKQDLKNLTLDENGMISNLEDMKSSSGKDIANFYKNIESLSIEFEQKTKEYGIYEIKAEDIKDLEKLNTSRSNAIELREWTIKFLEDLLKVYRGFANKYEMDVGSQIESMEAAKTAYINYYSSYIDYVSYILDNNDKFSVKNGTLNIEDKDILKEYNILAEKIEKDNSIAIEMSKKMGVEAEESNKKFNEAQSKL